MGPVQSIFDCVSDTNSGKNGSKRFSRDSNILSFPSAEKKILEPILNEPSIVEDVSKSNNHTSALELDAEDAGPGFDDCEKSPMISLPIMDLFSLQSPNVIRKIDVWSILSPGSRSKSLEDLLLLGDINLLADYIERHNIDISQVKIQSTISLLHYAISLDNVQLVTFLLNVGMDPYELDENGQNCFDVAYQRNNTTIQETLLAFTRGYDTSTPGNSYRTDSFCISEDNLSVNSDSRRNSFSITTKCNRSLSDLKISIHGSPSNYDPHDLTDNEIESMMPNASSYHPLDSIKYMNDDQPSLSELILEDISPIQSAKLKKKKKKKRLSKGIRKWSSRLLSWIAVKSSSSAPVVSTTTTNNNNNITDTTTVVAAAVSTNTSISVVE